MTSIYLMTRLVVGFIYPLFLFRILHTAAYTSDKRDSDFEEITSPSEGNYQAHFYRFANTSAAPCQAVLLLNVGTSMAIGDYSDIAQSIIADSPSIVTIIMDSNPGNVQKQNGYKFIEMANKIAATITTIVPSCSPEPPGGYFIGGHSGGGEGAVNAMIASAAADSSDRKLGFPVVGYVGLAPYRISVNDMKISVPSLVWGFSRMSCAVSPKEAASAAYNISLPSSRLFYDVQTTNSNSIVGGPHCSFANQGCLGFCSGGEEYSWIHESVGRTIGLFTSCVLTDCIFEMHDFDILDRNDVLLYVNTDTIPNTFAQQPSDAIKA